jgi:peptidoglycan/xylan/chitin deacetylase (PgdA/CDA1 family)
MKAKEIIYNTITTPIRFFQNLMENPAIILIYHRVKELENDRQMLAVKPENFYRQIEHLKNNYNLLSPDEFADILSKNKNFSRNSVLLTFDDGYADNLINAVPILESLEAQSVFYITTSMLDANSEAWWDNLEKIFIKDNLPPDLQIRFNGKTLKFKTSNLEEIEKTYFALHPLLKYSKAPLREMAIKQLLGWSECSGDIRESHRFLNSAELKKMSESRSAVIGAHTHTHTPLSILNYAEQLEDISASVQKLKDFTGIDVKYFSYPFGVKKDYNNDSINICKTLGFRFVCANYYSQIHSWTDPFQLPRILIRDWNFDTFSLNLKKYFRY